MSSPTPPHFRLAVPFAASPHRLEGEVIPGDGNRRRQPVIICGTHGGGTSFTTKMLRYCGLFVGNDVEPFKARKFHESDSFRAINILLFKQLGGDENGMNDQFIRDYISNFKNEGLRTRMEETVQSRLREAEDRFSAGDSTVFERPWGWKDPRNSVNLHFWLRHFPEAKILMVKKEERNKRSKSVSGKWFRESTDFQREFYYNPGPVLDLSCLAADRILTVQFEDLTSRQDTLDLVTGFCGLGHHSLTGVLQACSHEKPEEQRARRPGGIFAFQGARRVFSRPAKTRSSKNGAEVIAEPTASRSGSGRRWKMLSILWSWW